MNTYTLTLTLPDELQQAVEAQAAQHGGSVPNLFKAWLLERLEDLEDARDIEEAQAAVARGEDEMVPWETVKQEEGW